MTLPTQTTQDDCSREKIAAYLDRELAPGEESALEKHVAGCRNCLAELNLQKQMFSVLGAAFDDETAIELPKNFAKVVATRAETNVKGLRSKSERVRALFFCAIILFAASAGIGLRATFAPLGKFGEQVLAVAMFFGHLLYDFVIGITIILRSVVNQPVFNSFIALMFFFAALIFSVFVASRYIYNSDRP